MYSNLDFEGLNSFLSSPSFGLLNPSALQAVLVFLIITEAH